MALGHDYITSTGHDPIPTSDEFSWFNLWSKRESPYHELKSGDTLYWYDPDAQAIILKSQVISAVGFEYGNSNDAQQRLIELYGEDPKGDTYFDDNVDKRRYGFVFRVKVLEDLFLPKPDGDISFPLLGWLSCSNEYAQLWLSQESSFSSDDFDRQLRLWLFRFALHWSVPKEQVPPVLGRLEVQNRQNAYPLLAAALTERPMSNAHLTSALRECWAIGEQIDIIKLNQFLKMPQSLLAIEVLLNDFPVDDRHAAVRINEFIDKLGPLGYNDPSSGKLNMSSAGLLTSVLLSASHPTRFVDFRQKRWSRLADELSYPLNLAGRSTYGEMIVRAGQFAKAITETATFQRWWPNVNPLWTIAGIAWDANSDRGLEKPKELANVDQAFEEEFEEGQLRLRQHFIRERSAGVVRLAKDLWKKTAPFLKCEVCGFSFAENYGDIGQNYIEAHHTRPIAKLRAGERTRVEDLVKVCANCHRMLHIGDECLTIGQLREKLRRLPLP